MSVDVEEYFQVWAFSDVIARENWKGFAPRAERSTRRILDLFDAADVKATFFILGWIAKRAPGLVREIAARGHEIASHGFAHVKVFDQTAEEFRDDVLTTRRLLEDIAGVPVVGYRAAGFSIDARAPFAYEVLAETGHLYSSSTHPIAHDHYGDPAGRRDAHEPGSGGVIEAPVATADVFGRRFSAAGGGWFRVAPYGVSKALLNRARVQLDGPAVFYFHPWEIDPHQPRVPAPLKSQARHYLGLRGMERKLVRLLRDYRWTRIDEALGLGGGTAARAPLDVPDGAAA